MAKCDLSVVLDRSEPRYRVGETVSGRVEVQADTSVRCSGLQVRLRWKAHGRGNTHHGGEQTLVVHQGDWQAGEMASYPFSFRLPPGPLTYHGHYLNVDWVVQAQADIPWAIDPKAEQDLIVEQGEAPGESLEQLHTSTSSAGNKPTLACGLLFSSFFIVPGVLMAGGGVLSLLSGNFEGLIMIPFGSVFALAGVGALFAMGGRTWLAQRKLGQVEVELKPNQVRPGDRVQVTVFCTPRSAGKLNALRIVLRGEERVVSGSGTNRSTHTHTLAEESHEFPELAGEFQSGGELYQKLELTVPADAPPSFSASDNELSWSVEVHLDVAGWPDYQERHPLVVIP